MERKAAYRNRASFIKNSHGYLTNRIVETYSLVVKEPMEYAALAKRAKNLAMQEKASEVKKKDGIFKTVHKYKRRKRFGSSIGRRSPAAFIKQLESKELRYGGLIYDVNASVYRASQYDHAADDYTKYSLSDRVKEVGGHLVQRDAYSGFLLWNSDGMDHPDRDKCIQRFPQFLEMQEKAIFDAMANGDPTGNFGLKDFLAANVGHKPA